MLTQAIQSWLEHDPAETRSLEWRILAVTASADMRAALTSALGAVAGRNLKIVDDLDAAISLTAGEKFWDVLLVDGLTDLEQTRRARHEIGLSHAVIIALVGQPSDLRAAAATGADDAIIRPFNTETLITHIEHAIERRNLRNAVDQYWIATAQEHNLDLARFMIEQAPDALLLVDGDGTIQAGNATAAKLFCCEIGMLVGSPIGAFLDGIAETIHHDLRIQNLLDHFTGNSPEAIETFLHRLDGKTLPVEVAGKTITRLGQPGFSLSIRDISRRGAIIPRPASSNQELDRHAAIMRQLALMSSELMEPLEEICGRAEVIRQEALGPLGVPLYQTYAADIQQISRAILRLVERLLGMTSLNLPKD